MQAFFEKLVLPDNQSFRVHLARHPRFIMPWHFHPEYEIIYIRSGIGSRIVGDSIAHFNVGDLAFIGPNLPHVWESDKTYNGISEAQVIHFPAKFWEGFLLNIQEMQKISECFYRSRQGINFGPTIKPKLIAQIKKIDKAEGARRVLAFIELLILMAETDDYNLLASKNFTTSELWIKNERLKNVLNYIMQNFTENINLNDIAAIANLSKNAFCRFFKQHTNRSFVYYLNEIRLDYACRLLIESEHSIGEVCDMAGFKNQSNFNEQFKKLKGCSPKEFKQKRVC